MELVGRSGTNQTYSHAVGLALCLHFRESEEWKKLAICSKFDGWIKQRQIMKKIRICHNSAAVFDIDPCKLRDKLRPVDAYMYIKSRYVGFPNSFPKQTYDMRLDLYMHLCMLMLTQMQGLFATWKDVQQVITVASHMCHRKLECYSVVFPLVTMCHSVSVTSQLFPVPPSVGGDVLLKPDIGMMGGSWF